MSIKELVAKLLTSLDEAPDGHQAEVFAEYESDQLEKARKELVAQAKKIKDSGDATRLDEALAMRAAIDLIATEVSDRAEKAAEVAAKFEEALDGLDTDEEADTEDAPDDEAPETPEEEAAPEVVEEVKERVPLAAAISVANREVERERTPERNLDVIVSGAGPAVGRQYSDTTGLSEIGELFYELAPKVSRGTRSALVSMQFNYPEDRTLDANLWDNTERLNRAFDPKALVAAGGICDPIPADFAHPICSDRSRPIREGLPNFRLERGGIRYAPAATIGDLADAITVWDYDTDVDPGEATKPCPVLECEEELEVRVDAIVRCLTIGNFQARFNPEFFSSRLQLLLVEHDRAAEENAYDQIVAASTAVTGVDTGQGAISNLLISLDTAAAGLRSRHRLNRGTAMRAILPAWLQDVLRAHLAHQNPNGNPGLYAAGVSDWFSSRNISPIWSPDVDVFGAQGAGAIEEFPGSTEVVVFPEGTFVFGDGGTLDLGTEIRDSALNAVNNRQVFAETFEVTFKRGCESLAVAVDLGLGCICLGAAAG